jgi:hypothetical protein
MRYHIGKKTLPTFAGWLLGSCLTDMVMVVTPFSVWYAKESELVGVETSQVFLEGVTIVVLIAEIFVNWRLYQSSRAIALLPVFFLKLAASLYCVTAFGLPSLRVLLM